MNELFQLRPFTPLDAEATAKWGNNEKIAANLRDGFPYPYTLSDAREYISSVCAKEGSGTQIVRAIEVGGAACGSIGVFGGADVYRKSAEIGYWLAEPYWGRGIMSAAILQMARMAFAEMDIVRLYAEPYAHNAGSRRALEKAGFVLEGILKKSVFKNGILYDSTMYALLKDDFKDPQGVK